jgi:flagellar basal-body rod protein FlgC
MDLLKAIKASAAGLRVQGLRIRTAAENLANANSLAASADKDPYRRKLVTFKTELDRSQGVELVKVNRVLQDRSEFGKRYDPGHPAADAQGYVKVPNVNPLIELTDLREGQRSYEANLSAIDAAKGMISRALDLLK